MSQPETEGAHEYILPCGALAVILTLRWRYHEKVTRWNLQGCHLHVAPSPYRAHVCASMKPVHVVGVASASTGALAGGRQTWHLAFGALQPLEHGMSSGESKESAQQSGHDELV